MNDILCESCGYVLNGLPADGRCPECGTLVSQSVGDNRRPPAWEILAADRSKAKGFLQTSAQIIFRPTQFYRTFAVRGPVTSARSFASWHWWIASAAFGLAATTHAVWYWSLGQGSQNGTIVYAAVFAVCFLVMTIVTYFALDAVTRLAAWLTNWEATYRGIRLPYETVVRGMYYHAAHYVPVGLIALATVMGYQLLLETGKLDLSSTRTYTGYLYVLSAEVILGAVYLFNTYWIGMRNMMYANR